MTLTDDIVEKYSNNGEDNMAITIKQLIDEFANGATEGFTGTKSNPGNLLIKGSQLIHYQTPIAERTEDGWIINLSQYSIQTGSVQKQIKERFENVDYCVVKKVPRDYKGSLKDFQK